MLEMRSPASQPLECWMGVLIVWPLVRVHFLHRSNPDELNHLHLKLILLSQNHLENSETLHLQKLDRLNGISSRTSFVNLHHYTISFQN